ncbi:uncharacterized protein CDAR_413991 [Caerostris darwini]|uniref:Ciliary microtubule inner protein 2A-C-like domain-containing protein n=1 Tax=Caerostris darwini TaxID=1538125 RepID=A0AAV4RBS0_9ARAC|nr:uncharacterized protein CDAR_413991 [Caerostris darwini]
MPRTEDYHYSHGSYTPEPHCIPGYTGYLPGFGPHKLYQFGKTYGKMTHDIMARHPVAGERFSRILSCDCNGRGKRDDTFKVWQHEHSTSNPKYTNDMVPGYTGHVPKKESHCGQGFQKECRRGISDFQKLKMCESDCHKPSKYVPPEDLLPRGITFPTRLCERPEHRKVPSYATFTNPMNYGQSVYEMSDLDPRKTYMPGYTGYYTGKCFDMGVTHSRGAHQDLCDLTSSKLERLVAEKRPKINDWYRCPVLYPPQPPVLDGYFPPEFQPCNPVPGYAGHIPGYRDCGLGQSFGRSAGNVMRQRELMFHDGLRKP